MVSFVCLFYLLTFIFSLSVVRRTSFVYCLWSFVCIASFAFSNFDIDFDGPRWRWDASCGKFVYFEIRATLLPLFPTPQPSSVLRYFARKKERQKETDSKWKKLCQYLFKFITFVDLREKKDKNYRRNLIARHLKAIFVFCVYFSNTFRGFFWGIFWLWALRWVKPQVVSSLV